MKMKFRKAASLAMCAAMLVSLAQALPQTSMDVTAADYSWSSILKNDASWFGSSEGTALADTILQYQLSDGGWRKAMDDTSQTGSWAKSTIDNDATTSQIRVLARAYQQTGQEKYMTGCLKGIDLLLNGQYDNGGWPQVFNDAGTYHAHITYNDNAMIHVIQLLTDVRDQEGDFSFVSSTYASAADQAVNKGIQCLLDTQIIINGKYTGWCQQHDESTLEPTSGRAYELASVCTSESVNIINYLKTIENPSVEILQRINAAVEWMTSCQLNGIALEDYTNADGESDRRVVSDPDADPLWARFYYLSDGTTPMFVDRQSNAASNWDHIGAERRTGYAWYGTWPKNLVKAGITPIEPTVLTGKLIQELTLQDMVYGTKWSIDESIQNGDAVYGDREVTYPSLPEALIGAEYIRTACDSKFTTEDLAVFTVSDEVDLYIAMDVRVTSLPGWMGDWEAVGMTIENSDSVQYALYKKSADAGETITLGVNGQSAGCVQYTVFVTEFVEEPTTEATTEPTTEPTTAETTTEPLTSETVPSESEPVLSVYGDVNADGDFTLLDIVMMQKFLISAGTLNDYAAGDVCEDNKLNAFDLGMMKRSLLKRR